MNFGQKIVTATPRLATRVSFQALGKKNGVIFLSFTVCLQHPRLFLCHILEVG